MESTLERLVRAYRPIWVGQNAFGNYALVHARGKPWSKPWEYLYWQQGKYAIAGAEKTFEDAVSELEDYGYEEVMGLWSNQ